MKISKPIMITAGALILLGVITASAIDNQISACVANDSGKIRIINFLPNMTKQCAPTETLLIWNKEGIQGPKGDTGEKGEPGLPAQHGAGNIAQDDQRWRTSTLFAAAQLRQPFRSQRPAQGGAEIHPRATSRRPIASGPPLRHRQAQPRNGAERVVDLGL